LCPEECGRRRVSAKSKVLFPPPFVLFFLANFQGLEIKVVSCGALFETAALAQKKRRKREFLSTLFHSLLEKILVAKWGATKKNTRTRRRVLFSFSPPSTRSPFVMSRKTTRSKEEEAVLKKTGLSSLDAFIDEVHTSLISLHLNEPPLFFALKALQRRSQKEDEGVGPTRVPIPKQMICEFGVGAGHTLQKIKEQFPTGKTIVGFDSFEGLPENWIPEWRKGSFSQGGEIPKEVLGENVSIIKGLFSDTVPKFFETTDFKDVELLLLHIDCDLYRSTKDVLGDGLATTLKENKFFMSSEVPLYVAFDELIDYPTYEDHEIKALYEFLNENKDWLECVVIGADGREDTGTKLRFYYPDEICPHRVLTLFRPTKRARKEWEAKEKEKRAAASRWNFCAMS
tara:strand:+ start:279 stop:1475 length:1197 start_codon:yes stop_codon:yes gene_type:complete